MPSATPVHLPLEESLAVRFSPDGSFLAVSFRHRAILLDAHSGAFVTEILNGHDVYDIRFSPDGETIALSLPNNDVVLVTCRQGLATPCAWLATGDIHVFDFSACGKFLVTLTERGALSVVDLATAKFRFKHDERLETFACSRQRNLWVTAEPDGFPVAIGDKPVISQFRVWSWPLNPVRSQVLPYRVPAFRFLALSPDGELLAVLFARRQAGVLQVYSISRQIILHEQPTVTDPSMLLEWSPCGRYLAFGTRNGAGVGVLDFHTRQQIADVAIGRVKHHLIGDWPRRIAFSPDGALLAIAARNGRVVKLARPRRRTTPVSHQRT